MSEKATLVVLAAGMGSRFGGLKQVTPVGPGGECILEYSIYDAMRAGFGKIVIVIKKAIEDVFRQQIGSRIPADIPVEYVYQELDMLPDGYTVPDGRIKPWGTGHAVLCAKPAIRTPFAVINADDFYGASCYRLLADFLAKSPTDGQHHIALVGYPIGYTLPDEGSVSRGVCEVDDVGFLRSLTERVHIERRGGAPAFTEDGGKTWTSLPNDCLVSMNCMGFPAAALDCFGAQFERFLQGGNGFNPEKSEFYFPFVVDKMVADGTADVRVLPAADRWYGMTNPGDRVQVTDAIAAMVARGVYPADLWA